MSGNGEDKRDDAATVDEAAATEPEATGMAAVGDDAQELRKECADLRDQLLRKRAEFENYRRRVDRDRQLAAVDTAAAIFKAIVPVLDNFDRAIEAAGGDASVRQGIEMIRKELQAILDAQGVKAEEPLGLPFDPERHQALSHEPAPGFADGTIAAVFSKGYTFKDRLLRPAMVKVAKGTGDGPPRGAVH